LRSGVRGQGGYRKNSNHTQMIYKTKANEANGVCGMAEPETSGKVRGQINSVKRSPTEKLK